MELLKLKKHAELKAECKRLGLSTSGRKIDLHDRIQNHLCFTDDPQADIEKNKESDEEGLIDIPVNASDEEGLIDIPLNASDEEGGCDEDEYEDGETLVEGRKRKRRVNEYVFVANYESRSEARQAVEAEWRKWRNRPLKTGFKEWFKCKSLGCPVQLFIAGNQWDLKVVVMKSVNEHVHERQATVFGLNEVTKAEVEKLYVNGVVFPKRILYAIREMTDPG
jgi:hypothetical protein